MRVQIPHGNGQFWRGKGDPLQSIGNTVHVRRRCGLLLNYFDHLFCLFHVFTFNVFYYFSPVGVRSTASAPVSVCLFVCLSPCLPVCWHISKSHKFKHHDIFCPCYPWPWLGPHLTTVQCIMHFRFCGWRYVCPWSAIQAKAMSVGHILSDSPGGSARGDVWCRRLSCFISKCCMRILIISTISTSKT